MPHSTFHADLQSAEFDFHRAVFGIRPVELHEAPGWWSQRVCWATRGWGRYAAECRIQELAREHYGTCSLIDHWGLTRLDDGTVAYVTEPYCSVDEKLIEAIAKIAGLLGVHARILSPWQSWWYPGWTVRIEFSECRSTPLCRACKSREEMRDESRARRRERRKAGAWA
jgi:hypothetical protein